MVEIDYKFKQTEKALYDYNFLKGYIELRNKDLLELTEYQGVSASALSLTKASNSKVSDPTAGEVIDMEKVRETWAKSIKVKESFIFKIDYAMTLLNEIEKQIIEMKYLKGIRSYIIADDLGYSPRQINRIKKNTIDKISIILWGG